MAGLCAALAGTALKIDAWAIQRNERARPFRWTHDGSPLKEAN
ncbi:hypothetical protein [Streptomyces gibsoniae]|uniref:Transposase n=1 Tax=Streptomyces gibsoniae TaxID=3075529 RepID=A0ABU2UAQ3_9ACTN|nr:hypothetical protein [Streptomyces sp. DSM 41699]MDT0470116.1 hypothetical protein [Streptomyces sp. DSM 41699]